ncbi:hypothetical protein BO83DRAFT_172135 [Aspergillus eucalypticola CBS 122712]|uniref:Uncharacterized protein n=1 Tax=Aspergillus eucalypticola (strain CBS 122712 / IBT 29274) TaxID=1448314 RepID=A0A317WAS8_ASPEC|nr:uncharacterized protein BO83DRAFT_172135 [Aspergillus eucalypticola CBS 122712]PWY81220.1 hypothetical protein BO83DRAFT_172135 [Aspergillus eucalypticola CBS 122712]
MCLFCFSFTLTHCQMVFFLIPLWASEDSTFSLLAISCFWILPACQKGHSSRTGPSLVHSAVVYSRLVRRLSYARDSDALGGCPLGQYCNYMIVSDWTISGLFCEA